MRVATKYPRIAARYLEETGRQAEIVEVKGSVELAPLTGMVEAIVDLTATGTTLRENNLVDARGDRRVHRPADRQPRRAQAEGGADRRAAAAAARRSPTAGVGLRCASSASTAAELGALGGPPASPRTCARSCRTASRSQSRCARSSRAVRDGGDAAVLDYTRALRHRRAPSRAPLLVAPGGARRGDQAHAAGARGGPAGGDRQRRAASRRPASGTTRPSSCRRASAIALREMPVASAGDLRARRPRAVPEHRRDGRRHRARRRRDRRGRLRPPGRRRARSTRRSSAPAACAASSASTAWAARRRSPRSPTAPRRSRAVDVIVGPGNLYVQEAKRQLSAIVGIDGFAGPQRPAGRARRRRRRARAAPGGARHARPGRARRGQPRRRRLAVGRASATRSRRRSSTLVARAPDGRRRGLRARRGADARARRSRSPTRSRPSTCS